MKKVLALIEVILVRGLIFFLAVRLAGTIVTRWQMDHLPHVYTSHLLFILVPVIWLVATRRNLADHGFRLDQIRKDWQTAMSAYLPVAFSGAVLGFVPYTTLPGGLIVAAVQIGVLFWLGHTLTHRPDPKSGLITIGLSVVLFGFYGWFSGNLPDVDTAILRFIYYLVFVGLGEEVLYRGFLLTRLNDAFGKPFEFYGVRWGWGAVIAAALFGFSHVLNGWNVQTGEFVPLWGWGLWTFFGAFVFTYLREKSGSVLPGAIVHGLPQALLALFLANI